MTLASWSTLALLALAVPSSAPAQWRTSVTPPALGVGVDTMPANGWGDRWKAPAPLIYRRWAEFLASDVPRYTMPGAIPSPYWSAAEQKQWISFPLALNFVSSAAAPTVLDIRPAAPGSDSVYVVKTLFQQVGTNGGARPLALLRVYAVRERGTWVFSNALPRLTHGWQHTSVGPFDYYFPSGYRFDRMRAARAAAFADSVAHAFGVASVTHVAYYLTESPDEMNRIIGLDWYPSSADGGAFSSGANRLLVSGNPALGENYRHEIVHVVLDPLARHGVHPLLWEGIATALGGTLGMDARAAHREYAAFLRRHPEVTLDTILHESYDQGFRPAGAVVCRMVLERGGSSALKTLLTGGYTDADLKAGLQRALGRSWAEVQVEWRQRALAPE